MLLVQLSDPHIVEEGELLLGGIDTATFLREAVEHVNRLDPQPDLVLLTGDLVNEGRPEEYEHLRAAARAAAGAVPPRARQPRPHRRAAGRLPRPRPRRAGGRADGVIEGPLRIVTLDSSRYPEPGGSLDPEQLEWLDQTLGGAPDAADGRRRAPPAVRDGHRSTWTRWRSTPRPRPGWRR